MYEFIEQGFDRVDAEMLVYGSEPMGLDTDRTS